MVFPPGRRPRAQAPAAKPFTYPAGALRPSPARAVRGPSRLPPDQQTFPGLGQPPSLAVIPADGGPDHISADRAIRLFRG